VRPPERAADGRRLPAAPIAAAGVALVALAAGLAWGWVAALVAALAATLACALAWGAGLERRRAAADRLSAAALGSASRAEPERVVELMLARIDGLVRCTRAAVVRFEGGEAEELALRADGALWPGAGRRPIATVPLLEVVRAEARPAVLAPCPPADLARAWPWPADAAACRAVAWIPLIADGRVVGALGLTSDRERAFSRGRLASLETAGAVMGAALASRRALDDLRETERDARRIAELAGETSRAHDPAEAEAAVCRAALDLLGGPFAALLVPRTDGAWLETVAVAGWARAGRVPAGDGAAARALAGARSVVAEPGADPALRALAPDGRAPAAVIEPVVAAGGVVALLAVGLPAAGAAEGAGAAAALEALAGEAAHAVERARLLGTIEVQSATDALTGVQNRRTFEAALAERLAFARAGGRAVCLAMIDLDHLGAYNERHGRQAGDRLLRAVAAALQAGVRQDDLVGRRGGGVFLVAFSDAALATAERLVHRLLSALPHGTTASVGLAAWTRPEDVTRLLERAEEAVREAKGAGRDRIVLAG
jgi:diguanylate cyclase (GGDEF)-like protein